jgi:hydrogenase maturation protease
MNRRPPVLVIGFGNPGRGDDGAGPELIDHLGQFIDGTPWADQVETMVCFQLMIEHAESLNHRSMVVFVDASEVAEPPCHVSRVVPQRDRSYTSHELSPAALLDIQQRAFCESPEDAWLLEIPGRVFGLGQPMSDMTRDCLAAAVATLNTMLIEHCAGQPAQAMHPARR